MTEESNAQVVQRIVDIQSGPETDYGYRKMYFALMLLGYYINHKKVYRLMKQNNLLKKRYKHSGKTYAKYRIVTPKGPLEVLEMDIKYIWVTQARRHAFILSIIDTFTRAILHWQLGFTMNRLLPTICSRQTFCPKMFILKYAMITGHSLHQNLSVSFLMKTTSTRFSHIHIHRRRMAISRAFILFYQELLAISLFGISPNWKTGWRFFITSTIM